MPDTGFCSPSHTPLALLTTSGDLKTRTFSMCPGPLLLPWAPLLLAAEPSLTLQEGVKASEWPEGPATWLGSTSHPLRPPLGGSISAAEAGRLLLGPAHPIWSVLGRGELRGGFLPAWGSPGSSHLPTSPATLLQGHFTWLLAQNGAPAPPSQLASESSKQILPPQGKDSYPGSLFTLSS